MLIADAKEWTFSQLLRKKALLKHGKKYKRSQALRSIYGVAVIKYKFFLEKTTQLTA